MHATSRTRCRWHQSHLIQREEVSNPEGTTSEKSDFGTHAALASRLQTHGCRKSSPHPSKTRNEASEFSRNLEDEIPVRMLEKEFPLARQHERRHQPCKPCGRQKYSLDGGSPSGPNLQGLAS